MLRRERTFPIRWDGKRNIVSLGKISIPLIFLAWLFGVINGSLSASTLVIHGLFVGSLLIVGGWAVFSIRLESRQMCTWSGCALVGGVIITACLYAESLSTWASWVLIWFLYLSLMALDEFLGDTRHGLWRMGIRGILALMGGVSSVALAQVESHFADEEFFVALQAVALSVFLFLLLVVHGDFKRRRQPAARKGILYIKRSWLVLGLVLFVAVGTMGTIHAYQRSFYADEVPVYPGISSETPFICGGVLPDSQVFSGEVVFQRLLARVEANPHKGPPEHGMLALGTGERRWVEAFRESILHEAAAGRFTSPANSVKSTQYEAALRAYYFPRVQEAFPDIFSEADEIVLRSWFASINRRALTVEWVDWMYALAFSKWPEGPYENQENGAGLLAVLETSGLSSPELSPANQDYLERNPRGWNSRFRNTDDALIYQPGWINNAYFQSLYTGNVSRENLHLSFEWLLLQSLPDGASLRYNHPAKPSLAGTVYLGAVLLEDPRYVWLAGRALDVAEAQNIYLYAQPGVERPVVLPGYAPTQGSCLLYGDSGLPNQQGPLAPDKIIFRDGWSKDATYLLLNLRFTGWHRYKASNTITSVYQKGPLVSEVLDRTPFTWLPVGRSVFRDKRVPRENLNGLLVERSGLSAVLYTLTGVGGPWAQDPPYYAEVVNFETHDELDWVHTRLTNWQGWQHDRRVYFYHDGGPIVVVDEANGPPQQAALTWHLAGGGKMEGYRLLLREGDSPVEIHFVPLDVAGRFETTSNPGENSGVSVVYLPVAKGRLRLVTVFLPEQWVGADVKWNQAAGTLRVESKDGASVVLPFSEAE